MRKENFLNVLECFFHQAEWAFFLFKGITKIINAKTIYKRTIKIPLIPKMHGT